MQGIAIGRCRKTDGLLFYSPHTKQIYTTGDYKLDEGRNTPQTFNLQYDGGIFLDLYDHNTMNTSIEPYPEGTPVVMQIQLGISEKPVTMRGSVISVPIPVSGSQLPANDGDAPPYVIRLVDGSTHRISPLNMEVIIHVERSVSGQRSIAFPTWLGTSQSYVLSRRRIYEG